MSKVKFFAFSKASSSVPIYSVCQEKPSENQLKIQAGKVLNQLKNLNLGKDERQKINTGNGCWFCKKDNKEIIYLVLCSPNYPQRHAYAAINLLRDHLEKLGNYQTEPDSSLKLHCKDTLKEICQKYENLKGIDKIYAAGQHVEQLRSSLSDSTRKMVGNQSQLQELEEKSETLKANANQFNESANQLERLMYWRNCKLKILIGLVIIALICIIVVPIATR